MDSEIRDIHIQYEIIKNTEEKTSSDVQLMNKALAVADLAYAPYSSFRVGAAVLLEDGNIVTGSNQENAAYSSGLCAERVAMFAAASQNPEKKILKIAVAAKNKNGKTTQVTPCGSCRQVLLEYEYKQNHPIQILLLGPNKSMLLFYKADALLPLGFNKFQLS